MNTYKTGKSLFCVLAASGCMAFSSVIWADEVPEEAFELARQSIEEAQEVKAGEVASDELLMAEQKLQQARDYNEEGDEETTQRLLQQSRLHSEYAEVLAMENSAEMTLAEINETLKTLNAELRRQQ